MPAPVLELTSDNPEERLVVYGSLAPGGANNFILARLGGDWQPCAIRGRSASSTIASPAAGPARFFLAAAAVLVPVYGSMARSPTVLMLVGPLLGFVGHGYFSMFGAFLAELFPTAVRATGQGLTYNAGRGLGALAPYTIGYLATLPPVGIGSALAVTSAFFLLGAMLIMFFPDTSRRELA